MNKSNNRFDRINEELKREISNIINYDLKNSNITGLISVTNVKVTTDLKYAKIYVSIMNTKSLKNTLAALKKSSGYIRSQIAKTINLRITPELIFELDDSIQYGAKIDAILKDIIKDIKPKNENENKKDE